MYEEHLYGTINGNGPSLREDPLYCVECDTLLLLLEDEQFIDGQPYCEQCSDNYYTTINDEE